MHSFKRAVHKHIQDNSSLYAFVTVLFLMGVIFGAVVVNSLSFAQKEDLYTYLSRFFMQALDGSFAERSEIFQQGFSHYIKYIMLIWLLGLSVIGLPIILVLLFLKGVVVGFTVGFLINQMSWHGFLLSFVAVLPQNILLIPAFVFITAASVSFSIRIIMQLAGKRTSVPFLHQLFSYTFVVTAAGIIVLAGVSLEALLSPPLIKQVIQWSTS
ncbi:stage II sporulation protein M [Fictibacillus iocasae]|uniref:Stage II sporulation protein M n=1 Tax=Fictibacillus iocasae TaxID=2715437 RepID=A0ABW2NPQ3_9BACL